MASRAADNYSTRELSEETWPDLERLFLKRGSVGDAWWCWCTHHHIASYSSPEHQQPRTRAERAERNREKKRRLVKNDQAHGIIVYSDDEPVGWCQYGLREELPRIDNTINYRKLKPDNQNARLWRITCFVIQEEHRQRGVAGLALKAAMESIRKKGGGVVEAYPVSKTDQGSNYIYCGTISMFQKAGFKTIAPLAQGRTSTVVMKRTI